MRRAGEARRDSLKNCAIILLLALVLPVSLNLLWSGSGALAGLGERVATFAAIMGMPDAGLELIREQFRTELYPQTPELPQSENPWLAAPQSPAQDHPMEDASPRPEREKEEEKESQKSPGAVPPRIPLQYQAPLLSESFSSREGGSNIRIGAGLLKNDTRYTNEEIEQWLETEWDVIFADTNEPQVLIYHTHATESFERYDNDIYDTRNNWRSTDNNNNMVAVGAAMAQVLEERGIGVIHDTTQHDYPSYNGSYEWSAKTISAYLEEYPTIQIVLDLHRDAMERENQTIVKPVEEIDGIKAAQIMMIAGCDNGQMNMPGWRDNMRFAAAFQNAMEERYPGLTRPVLLSYRKYNQDLSPGGLLLEFGSNANTLEEAVYSAQMAGEALADLIYERME